MAMNTWGAVSAFEDCIGVFLLRDDLAPPVESPRPSSNERLITAIPNAERFHYSATLRSRDREPASRAQGYRCRRVNAADIIKDHMHGRRHNVDAPLTLICRLFHFADQDAAADITAI